MTNSNLLLFKYDPMGHAECFKSLHGEKWLFVDGVGWLMQTENKTHYEHGGAISGLYYQISKLLSDRLAAYEVKHSESMTQADKDEQRELKAMLGAIKTSCKRTKSKIKDIAFNLEILLRRESESFDKINGMDALNVLNGFIDLKTGKLHKRSADSLFTYAVDIEYKESVDQQYGEWHEFLASNTLNGESDANWLQKAMGYTFSSSSIEECFIYLQGTRNGRNGKGVLLETISYIFGDYLTAERDINTFKANQNNPGGPRADLVNLRQSRLINVPEVSQYTSLSSTMLKQITGKSITKIEARNLQQSTFIKFVPFFVLWMDSNFEPNIDASDMALKNRIRIIEFPYHYTPNPNPNRPNDRKIIINFKEKFTRGEHRQAVFKWVVDGAVKWYAEGLGYPEGHEERAAELTKERDTLAQYMEAHNLIICPRYTNLLQTPSFYSDYKDWVKSELGLDPLAPNGFSQRLKGYGAMPSDKKKRINGIGHGVRFYRGVIRVRDIESEITEIVETYDLNFNMVEPIPFDTVKGAAVNNN